MYSRKKNVVFSLTRKIFFTTTDLCLTAPVWKHEWISAWSEQGETGGFKESSAVVQWWETRKSRGDKSLQWESGQMLSQGSRLSQCVYTVQGSVKWVPAQHCSCMRTVLWLCPEYASNSPMNFWQWRFWSAIRTRSVTRTHTPSTASLVRSLISLCSQIYKTNGI